jgi:hypothetical protein
MADWTVLPSSPEHHTKTESRMSISHRFRLRRSAATLHSTAGGSCTYPPHRALHGCRRERP